MSDLSVQLDPRSASTLAVIARVANRLGVSWMVTGAMARSLVFEGGHGLRAGRATRDWDLGVQVRDWESFQTLREVLEREHGFRPDARQDQRLHSPDGPLVDLIPFGGVEAEGGAVCWGQAGEFRLNVAGFQEAYQTAYRVDWGEGPAFRVVSPAGLTLLKVVAWRDRHAQHDRDGEDLAYLLGSYHHLIKNELFEIYLDVMDGLGYDAPLAGAKVLGLQVAEMAKPELKEAIGRWLASELADPDGSRLLRTLDRYLPAGEVGRPVDLVEQFEKGLAADGMRSP